MNSQSSSSSSSMPHLNTGFDNDLDSYLDLDQSAYTPSSASPASGKQPLHRPSFASSSHSFAGQSQQTFSGPSFQYDAYKQQTGLPIGGLANTFAVNQAMGLQYNGSHSGFVMPTETLNIPLSNLDDFDFARNSSVDMHDMDFDADSPSDIFKGQFVNPNALLGQDDSPTYTAPIRMYPGIHQQQAAQAKAQQMQKQQEMSARQQQQRQIEGQRPLPTQSKPTGQKDPHVEESISRLLSQMRHNSVTSADDSADTPTGSQPSLAARLKKEEDEMDEDERLLASEEGKKLSSKERRQLRNKVSARAFRSRRKEYIGQLEGEIAQKVQEADELRSQNRQLMEENTRLTDLTRMLLSSSAFSGFLNELSANGMPAPPTTASTQQNQSKPQPRPTRKDVNPNQASRQMQSQQPHVNMAMIPEINIDFSVLEQPTNSWNPIPSNDFQVFSVSAVPEVPVLDLTALSSKGSSSLNIEATKEVPQIAEIPSWVKSVSEASVEPSTENSLDKAFDLYHDQPSTPTIPSSSSTLDSFLATMNPKPNQSALVLSTTVNESSSLARLKRMCASLDETCEHLAAYLPDA